MRRRPYIYLFLFCFAIPHLGYGQGSSLQVVSGTVCTGVVETPLFAQQLQGIASVSLKINYDTSELRYLGFRNLHPSLSNALVTSNNSQFILAWFSLSAAQLTNDTMLVLRWEGRPTGTSALQFDVQTPGNCEVTNLQGQALPVQFMDGSAAVQGATPPTALTPLQLFGVLSSTYQFMYQRSACTQQVVFQTARDATFNNIHHSGLAISDSFALADFRDIQPSLGDSVIWWRFGGVYGSDTAWTATGRMSFALQLSAKETSHMVLKCYPNPFSRGFWIDLSGAGLTTTFELRTLQGQLLDAFEISGGLERYFYEPQIDVPDGIVLLIWRNTFANGTELLKKLPY